MTQEQKRSLVKTCKLIFGENAKRAYQILAGGKVFEGYKYDDLVLCKEMFDTVTRILEETKDLDDTEFSVQLCTYDDEIGLFGELPQTFKAMNSIEDWENESWIFKTETKGGLPVVTGIYGNDYFSHDQSYFDEAFTKAVFKKFNVPSHLVDSSNFDTKEIQAPNGDKSTCAYMHELPLETLKQIIGYCADDVLERATIDVVDVLKDLIFKKFNLSGKEGYEFLVFILNAEAYSEKPLNPDFYEKFNDSSFRENLLQEIFENFDEEQIRYIATDYIDNLDTNVGLANTIENIKEFCKKYEDTINDYGCILSEMFPKTWADWMKFDGTIKSYREIWYSMTNDTDIFANYDFLDAGEDFDSFE